MQHRSLPIGIFAIGLLASASVAEAAIETWVSGTGTDAGNCPRTAPCRTFQFAHDQTNNNGAINVLTAGNFGSLTIAKPISVVADGVEAVINTSASGAGINVQAGGGAIVSLRGLTIDMRGTANLGILFVSGAALHVHNTIIRKVTQGIRFTPASGTPELYVSDTLIADTSQIGIYVAPTATGGANVVIARVQVEKSANNCIGFESSSSGAVVGTVRDSVVSGNPNNAIHANQANAGTTVLTIDRSVSVNNGVGIVASNAGATIRIGNSTVSGNGTGLFPNGGEIISYGTNKVDGNGVDGAPTSTIAEK